MVSGDRATMFAALRGSVIEQMRPPSFHRLAEAVDEEADDSSCPFACCA